MNMEVATVIIYTTVNFFLNINKLCFQMCKIKVHRHTAWGGGGGSTEVQKQKKCLGDFSFHKFQL